MWVRRRLLLLLLLLLLHVIRKLSILDLLLSLSVACLDWDRAERRAPPSVTRLCGFPQNLRISKVSCGKFLKFLFSKSAKIADF